MLLLIVLLIAVVFSLGVVYVKGQKEAQELNEIQDMYIEKVKKVDIPEIKNVEVLEGEYNKEEFSSQFELLNEKIKELELIQDDLKEEKLSEEVRKELSLKIQNKLEDLNLVKEELDKNQEKAERLVKKFKEEEKKKKAEAKRKEEEAKKLEKEKMKAEAKRAEEAKEKEKARVVSKENHSNTKQPSEGKTSSSNSESKQKAKANNTQSKPKDPPKKEPSKPKEEPKAKSYPKPAIGTVVRSNPYPTSGDYPYNWEHGTLTYIWDEKHQGWGYRIQYGMSMTNLSRWEDAATKAFPEPNRKGKKDGEKVSKGTIWIYFGG